MNQIIPSQSEILQYISTYSDHITEFTEGWCYAFASILEHRYHGTIYYLPIKCHFICKIDSTYYDVTGIVNPDEKPYLWKSYQRMEPTESKRIIRDCIMKDRS